MKAASQDAMSHVKEMLGAPPGAPEPKATDMDEDDVEAGPAGPEGHEDYEMPEGFMESAGDLHTMAQSKGGKRGFAQALYNLMCKFRDEG